MNFDRSHMPALRPNRGFTLLEALIALIVVAFGMLAIAGFQISISNTSDTAKQRSEATRLAEHKLEQLRSFSQVTASATSTIFDFTDITSGSDTLDPAASTDPYASNTVYARAWTVSTPVATDMFKTANVTVTWTDRSGASQSVKLFSVISQSDPVSLGTLGVGPGTTNYRRPKNRNLNIPYPATSLSGNQSAFQPPGASAFFVFDNDTGNILGKCAISATNPFPATNATVSLTSTGCSAATGYLLSGYIRFCTTNNCGGSGGSGQDVYSNTFDATKNLSSATPLSIDFSNQTTTTTPTYECFSQRQITLDSTATTVVDPGTYASNAGARFIAYACIINPVDHDSVSTTPLRWWGRTTINTDGTWTISDTGASNYRVCRYTADYNTNNAMSNIEHPFWYRGVTGALDNQNFLVIPGNGTCPTDKSTDAVSGDFVNSNTATHQPTSIGVLSFTCSTINCTGSAKTQIEPTLTSTDLPLE